MGREIKFRAWLDYGDGSGEMLPNIQNHINGDWAFGHIVLGNVDDISEPMQFTGLKDQNGVEIYEGDIVARNCGFGNDVYEVKYLGTGFNLPKSVPYGDGKVSTVFDYKYVVIGNIHQNPELIAS